MAQCAAATAAFTLTDAKGLAALEPGESSGETNDVFKTFVVLRASFEKQ
jgi:hypothetical protein